MNALATYNLLSTHGCKKSTSLTVVLLCLGLTLSLLEKGMANHVEKILSELVAPCTELDKDQCLYHIDDVYQTGYEYFDFSYYSDFFGSKVVGGARELKIHIRYPIGVEGKNPIIYLSHGGAWGNYIEKGKIGKESLPNWAKLFSRAGFITVGISHTHFGDDDLHTLDSNELQLCQKLLAKNEEECKNFKPLHWFRPHDIYETMRYVNDNIEEISMKIPEFRRIADLDNVAVAGHSAGSSGAITIAGAERKYINLRATLSYDNFAKNDLLYGYDPPVRPKAYMAMSPQGPGGNGFHIEIDQETYSHSWDNISEPVLWGTGAGDSSTDNDPANRRLPYELMESGEKARFYLHDQAVKH